MSTNKLPERPSLDHIKHQAKDLLTAWRAGNAESKVRVDAALPQQCRDRLALHQAQLVIAREYGFQDFEALRKFVLERATEAQGPTSEALIGQVASGRYRIDEAADPCLMGTAFRATNVILGERQWIKLLPPDAPGHHRAWMLREARATRRVKHRQVLQIHDIGEGVGEREWLWLVGDDRPTGSTLEKLQRDAQQPFPIATILDFTLQLTKILVAVHEAGVVHRSIGLRSVHVMAHETESAELRLAAFDFAHIPSEAPMAPDGTVYGDPEVMAPELARGEPAEPRSDLYSIGLLLFQLLTGASPLPGGSVEELLQWHRTGLLKPPLEIAASLEPRLAAICQRLLEKEPAARYASARELAEALATLG